MKRDYYVLIALVFITLLTYQCTETKEDKETGAALSQQYCGSCHLYPAPTLLDQSTWRNHVLPRMGAFMGIYEKGYERLDLLEKGPGMERVTAANIYPEQAILSESEWSAIRDFYLQNAPEQLAGPDLPATIPGTPVFKANFPEIFLSPPSTTFVDLSQNQIRMADANKKMFIGLDKHFEIQQQAKIGEGLVHLHETDTDLWLTVMGSFSPTDAPKGYILKLSKQFRTKAQIVVDQLQRPVHSSYADLNGDGLLDIIVSEFGKWTGGLSLHLQQADGSFIRKKLLDRSGAIKSELIDANEDGRMDILVLFGQGEEGFWLLENSGATVFTSRPILRFHPSMGSSTFKLYDWNKDGKEDILYTAGDNADYPPIVKPYHGVYIFEQNTNFEFKEVKFLPLPGAYGAVPGDFDQDGDDDIAAISFFPDYHNLSPLEFCLFEKIQDDFHPKTIDFKNQGRWITLDSGDLDEDGDLDLILGSLTFEAPGHDTLVQKWVKNGLPFVVLTNQTIKNGNK